KELGSIDKDGRLRLAVIRGIKKAKPHAYRVAVGANIATASVTARFVTTVVRMHAMDATTPVNLDGFLSAQRIARNFILAPAGVPVGGQPSTSITFSTRLAAPPVYVGLGITLYEIHARHAWEVGLHDQDNAAIRDDDDPVIPANVANAPVLELLGKRAKRSGG